MLEKDYDFRVFGFNEKNPIWESIMYIVDENIKAENEIAIGPDVSGEARVHACGRASSLVEFKKLLIEERRRALEVTSN